MDDRTVKIIESLFKTYYVKHKHEIYEPPQLKNREFAFQMFKSQGMIRHLAFETPDELRKYIVNNIPRHSFYSTAIYILPSAHDMDEKGWINAEIVFDIDADHLDTECRNEHDFWQCLNCGHKDKGKAPEVCPKCGSKNIKIFTWVCAKCLDRAKNETLKLIEDFLVPDFGINPKNIMVAFSGHRGFHIHVMDEEYMKLSSEERRELIDYIKALGLKLEILVPKRRKGKEFPGFDVNNPGWRGKIARKLYDLLIEFEERKSEVEGIIGKKNAEKLLENLDRIIVEIMDKPPKWTTLYRVIGRKNLIELLKILVKNEKCEVDEKVTIDTKRLIRLPGTLHGKTGLPVIILGLEDLEDFTLNISLSPFKGKAKIILLEEIPQNLTIFGENVGGKMKDKKEVHLPTAIYLSCKGLAEIEEII